jgi:glycosyltransferase involved in cell wall biosynthesis
MTAVSVVIPTFNRSALVAEAIDSVLAQEGNVRLETIVVDDGSTDDTRQSLSKYAGRITYRHQANAGMNAARNAGVREAAGRYVAFLDSDDVWVPYKAALQLEVMERLPDVGFAFSNFFAWRNGARTPNGLGEWMQRGAQIEQYSSRRYSSVELGISWPQPFDVFVCDIYPLSLYQPVVLPSTSLIRRDVLDELGPLAEDNWMCGDWEYFARASKQFGAAYLDLETALNRGHDDAVRLMRRPLADRTKQRIASIRRTWRADAEFMSRFGAEVDAVEAREWRALFKRTCYEGDLSEARAQLREIERLSSARQLKLKLLWWSMRLPFGRDVVAAIRNPAR